MTVESKSFPPSTTPGERGFTLIELLVGIAVSSLLLVALFQLLSDLTTVQQAYRQESTRTHNKVALRRILYQDLYSLPVNKPELEGTPDEFSRNTVAYSPEKGLRMETRVHYFTRMGQDQLNLIREWKWVDLHDDFQESTVLIRAEDIQFDYLTENGGSVRQPSVTDQKIVGINLTTDKLSMTVPVGTRDEESSEASEQPGPALGR